MSSQCCLLRGVISRTRDVEDIEQLVYVAAQDVDRSRAPDRVGRGIWWADGRYAFATGYPMSERRCNCIPCPGPRRGGVVVVLATDIDVGQIVSVKYSSDERERLAARPGRADGKLNFSSELAMRHDFQGKLHRAPSIDYGYDTSTPHSNRRRGTFVVL